MVKPGIVFVVVVISEVVKAGTVVVDVVTVEVLKEDVAVEVRVVLADV